MTSPRALIAGIAASLVTCGAAIGFGNWLAALLALSNALAAVGWLNALLEGRE